MDRLALALSAEGTLHHEYPKHIQWVAIGAWDAALKRILEASRAGVNCWVIHTQPNWRYRERYKQYGAKVITLDPGIRVCLQRASDQRPPHVPQLIQAWYARKNRKNETEDHEWR